MHRPTNPYELFDNPEAPSQADEIAKLERTVDQLERDLHAAIAKITSESEPDDDNGDDFDAHVNEMCKNGTPRLLAMAMVRKQFPSAFAAYQKRAPVADSIRDPRGTRANRAFEQAVAEIAASRKISKTAAMSAVRLEQPDLYSAMQANDD